MYEINSILLQYGNSNFGNKLQNYAVQEIRAIPAEPTDQVLDLVVTDRGVIRPQGEK